MALPAGEHLRAFFDALTDIRPSGEAVGLRTRSIKAAHCQKCFAAALRRRRGEDWPLRLLKVATINPVRRRRAGGNATGPLTFGTRRWRASPSSVDDWGCDRSC